MGHIAGIFADSNNYEDAVPFFEYFFKQDNNQYSYVHTLVFEEQESILGFVTGYEGALLHDLRQPIIDQLRKTRSFPTPDDETEAGEFYLDCISVRAGFQGKGIGRKLINAFCEKAQKLDYNLVGLIVDQGNPAARRFYEDLSFHVAGEKDFMGHRYFHMLKEV